MRCFYMLFECWLLLFENSSILVIATLENHFPMKVYTFLNLDCFQLACTFLRQNLSNLNHKTHTGHTHTDQTSKKEMMRVLHYHSPLMKQYLGYCWFFELKRCTHIVPAMFFRTRKKTCTCLKQAEITMNWYV